MEAKFRIDLECIRMIEPFRIIAKREHAVAMSCCVEQRADALRCRQEIGIEDDVDLLAWGARSGSCRAHIPTFGLGALFVLVDVAGLPGRFFRGATRRTGSSKSWSFRPNASSFATASRSPCKPSTRSTLA